MCQSLELQKLMHSLVGENNAFQVFDAKAHSKNGNFM